MAGLGDALKQEGRNIQKGFQDTHDLWMGQRPVPQQEAHSWGDWQPIGPDEKTEEEKQDDKPAGVSGAAADTVVNTEPPEFGPPIDGPTPYDPPIGPEPAQDMEP